MKQIYESNIVKETQNLVAEISNTACVGMNSEEIKAYNFGIEQTLYMLQLILENEDDIVLIHNKDKEVSTEILLEDLINKIKE
ncbi:hypothetical protein IJE86_07810 [bacterium]|nr:hypothetical protein [bacterium]